MCRAILAFVLTVAVISFVYAVEIESTGRATIMQGDVRSAQQSSLNGALLSGINRYMQIYVPGRNVRITADYLMFIDNYTILRRNIVDNAVVTTVRMNVNDLIREEMIGGHIATQTQTAVFTFAGLSNYIRDSQVRNIIARELSEKQFSYERQLQFEREIVDMRNHSSIVNAFRAVSTQYLIEFRFNVRSHGESCTLGSNMSYLTLGSNTSVPVLTLDVTMTDANTAQCVLNAVEEAVSVSLAQMRQSIPAPSERVAPSRYTLTFTNVSDLRTINDIMGSIGRRRLTISFAMNEFFNDEAVFNVESYLTVNDLAERITRLNIETIQSVRYRGNVIIIAINQGLEYDN